ncbi:SRPBCC family protein [Isoptericola croceus]|uniref:SRPBCC family protein n=1 Tax=Isoptericola croceus TaxID=3031406 RepID=UPI0023F93672|nr:SRPBCC family protein [Isoptericola croceus]
MTTLNDARGTLGLDPSGAAQIQFVRRLPVPPARAWAWLTEPELLQRWLPGCRIEPRVGGTAVFDFGEEGTATGEVTAVAEPHHLTHTWVWDGVPDSLVRWGLEADDGGTRLTLTHTDVAAGPAPEFAVGWHVMLDALVLAADGADDAVEAAWSRIEAVAPLYAD